MPLVACGLVLSGVVQAQGEQDYRARPSAGCTAEPTYSNTSYRSALAVGPAGEAYVLEAQAFCVVRLDDTGGARIVLGSGDRTEACPTCGIRIDSPEGLEIGPDGTLYIAERNSSQVLAIAPDGTSRSVAADPSFIRAYTQAFTLDAKGRLYVVDRDTVRRYDGDTSTVIAGGGGGDIGDGAPATSVRLGTTVSAITVGPDGSVYLAQEYGAYRVLRVDPKGRITRFAGTGLDGDSGDGGPATAANVVPAGLAVDTAGNVYISIRYGHRIRRVAPDGTITTWAGTGAAGYGEQLYMKGPAATARFSYPGDMTFAGGNLYVLDGEVVRRIDKNGMISALGPPPAPRTR